jgi:hypothetical protein
MYIIINNKTNKATTTNQKTIVASYIGVHRNTITNNLNKSNPTTIGEYTIYKGTFLKNNVSSGNTLSLKERQAKWIEKNEY